MYLKPTSAAKAPDSCAKMYGARSTVGNFPAIHIINVTAGLTCPPEILAVVNTAIAKEEPIANGLPVKRII